MSGLVSTLENVCTTFGTHDAVRGALKRPKYLKRERNNASLLSDSTNDCDLLVYGLASTMESACGSARITQCNVRLNVEISPAGEKYRIIFVKIDE